MHWSTSSLPQRAASEEIPAFAKQTLQQSFEGVADATDVMVIDVEVSVHVAVESVQLSVVEVVIGDEVEYHAVDEAELEVVEAVQYELYQAQYCSSAAESQVSWMQAETASFPHKALSD